MAVGEDRRIRKTRAALLKALLEMLDERSFHEISIKDLTDKADIARPTFYRNFNSTQEILLKELDSRAESFFDEVQEEIKGCTSFKNIMAILFSRWNDNADLFLAMYKAGMDHSIIDSFATYSVKYIRLLNRGDSSKIYMPKLHYFAGGAHNLFKSWLLEGKKQPVENMAAIMATDLFALVKNKNITLD